MNGAQEAYLAYIVEHKVVKARELIRLGLGWDVRKAISRLRKQGHPITNIGKPGQEAIYFWADGGQERMF